MIIYDKDEKIVQIVRRHRLALILEVIFLIIAAILPYVAYKDGLTVWLTSLFNPTAENPFFLSIAFYTLWVLFLWILFWIAWSDHNLDAWIITDGRVLDIEQTGLFRRRINAFRLDKITDIVMGEKGWLENIVGYGSLHISMEGDSRKFVIEEVPDPNKLKEILLREQQNMLKRVQRNVDEQIIVT